MTGRPVILLLAGEASGDLHGAGVARALLERWPDASLRGFGGDRMREAGVELLAGLDDLAVMGFVEVLRHLPFFWRLEKRLKAILEAGEVDLVLPIDYPGFNLRAAREAHRRGIPVLYYIAPQVWAWKPHRARRLAGEADRIAVILPFEEQVFHEAGGEVRFVGHPLLEQTGGIPPRNDFLESHGLDPSRPVLALFPGSRKQEIRRHGELFGETGRRVVKARPEVQLAMALAPSISPDALGHPGITLVRDGRTLLH
ncbi:lipid-A-disaccharide synthase, partial [Gemmatimonadota bacterium]